MIPALIPSWSAWQPSVAETWVSADQLQVDRQRADLQRRRQFLRLLEVFR